MNVQTFYGQEINYTKEKREQEPEEQEEGKFNTPSAFSLLESPPGLISEQNGAG